MTENKRFTYDSKTVSILKDGDFWLDGQVDTACNHSEICNELNKLVDENEQLEKENKLLYENIDFLKRFIEKQGFKIKLDNELIK